MAIGDEGRGMLRGIGRGYQENGGEESEKGSSKLADSRDRKEWQCAEELREEKMWGGGNGSGGEWMK
ncbi:hypothetical protein ACH5RR_032079 [Cinchona calisaya]|uniref:Uncharacterized protein n=1 Tax=Cinchona calisaya TaxID=153742 RepID=A0ABD2YH30_9GENT